MATFLGKDGVVKVGTNTVAEVKSFTVKESTGTVEDTSMGDQWTTHKPTMKSWSGSMVCHWDDTDTTGQQALTNGAEVTLKLYPEGASTGDHEISGSAIITDVETQQALDGIVERNISFIGSGALTHGTAA